MSPQTSLLHPTGSPFFLPHSCSIPEAFLYLTTLGSLLLPALPARLLPPDPGVGKCGQALGIWGLYLDITSPSHNSPPQVDFPSAEALVPARQKVDELDPPATADPTWVQQVQGPIHRLPAQGHQKTRAQSRRAPPLRARFRLMHLSVPDHPSGTLSSLLLHFPSSRCSRRGPIRDLHHPQPSTTTPRFSSAPGHREVQAMQVTVTLPELGSPCGPTCGGEAWAQSCSYLGLLVAREGRWSRTPASCLEMPARRSRSFLQGLL